MFVRYQYCMNYVTIDMIDNVNYLNMINKESDQIQTH